ncbi:MAG: hypothetical protein ACTHK6_06980 [Solirubrobacterales bacterium]
MSESPERIKKHIAILETFEQRFGEWVTGLHNEQLEDEPPAWSNKERAERERELREMAVPAQKAMEVSGVGMLALAWPPAMRRQGVMVGDLPGLMFYDGPSLAYESSDGLDVQRKVLDRIPSQLAGLRLQLEEAEDAEKEASMRQFGEVFEHSRDQHRQRDELGEGGAAEPTQLSQRAPKQDRPWWENPWVVGIGVTVIGGLILFGIIAMLSTG